VRRYVEDLASVIDGTPQVHALAGDGNDHLHPGATAASSGAIALSGLDPSFRSSMECAPKARLATDSALEEARFSNSQSHCLDSIPPVASQPRETNRRLARSGF
jgi:hypothetical protein